jgi:hypothetical protein
MLDEKDKRIEELEKELDHLWYIHGLEINKREDLRIIVNRKKFELEKFKASNEYIKEEDFNAMDLLELEKKEKDLTLKVKESDKVVKEKDEEIHNLENNLEDILDKLRNLKIKLYESISNIEDEAYYYNNEEREAEDEESDDDRW